MTTQSISAAIVAAFITVSAAALDAEKFRSPKPLGEDLKLRMRKIAVRVAGADAIASVGPESPANYRALVRRRNAREAAEEVFEDYPFPLVGNAPPAGIGYAIALALPPKEQEVAVYAALSRRDREHVESAMEKLGAQEMFARAFHRAAERQSGRRFQVALGMDDASDTIVEIVVESVGLKLRRKNNYNLAMRVRTRIVSAAEGQVIYDEASSYESPAAAMSDWAFNEAQPFKEQVARACEQLSARIVREVLPSGVPDRLARAERDGLFVARANPLHPRHLSQLGNVGVISTSSAPSIAMQRPLTKTEAVREARATLNDFVESVSHDFVIGHVGAALAIPLALAGEAHAGFAGLTEKRFDRADRALVAAAESAKPQPALRKRFLEQANAIAAYPIVEVPKPFPPGEEAQFSQFRSVMAGTLAWLPEGQTAEYYLRSQNVQTVLEIEVISPALNGADGVNPRMRFHAGVRATLWSVQDGLELASCELRHRSAARRFAEWAKNDAAQLRRELAVFTEGAGAAIIQQLAIPAWRPPQPMIAAK